MISTGQRDHSSEQNPFFGTVSCQIEPLVYQKVWLTVRADVHKTPVSLTCFGGEILPVKVSVLFIVYRSDLKNKILIIIFDNVAASEIFKITRIRVFADSGKMF